MEEFCPLCMKRGLKKKMKALQINMEEAVWMCESEECIWPMGHKDIEFIPRKIGESWSCYWNTYKPRRSLTTPSRSDWDFFTPPYTPKTEVSPTASSDTSTHSNNDKNRLNNIYFKESTSSTNKRNINLMERNEIKMDISLLEDNNVKIDHNYCSSLPAKDNEKFLTDITNPSFFNELPPDKPKTNYCKLEHLNSGNAENDQNNLIPNLKNVNNKVPLVVNVEKANLVRAKNINTDKKLLVDSVSRKPQEIYIKENFTAPSAKRPVEHNLNQNSKPKLISNPIAISDSDSILISDSDSIIVSDSDSILISDFNPILFSDSNTVEISNSNTVEISDSNTVEISYSNPILILDPDPIQVSNSNPILISDFNPPSPALKVKVENPEDTFLIKGENLSKPRIEVKTVEVEGLPPVKLTYEVPSFLRKVKNVSNEAYKEEVKLESEISNKTEVDRSVSLPKKSIIASKMYQKFDFGALRKLKDLKKININEKQSVKNTEKCLETNNEISELVLEVPGNSTNQNFRPANNQESGKIITSKLSNSEDIEQKTRSLNDSKDDVINELDSLLNELMEDNNMQEMVTSNMTDEEWLTSLLT